jgi:hypothetical protein
MVLAHAKQSKAFAQHLVLMKKPNQLTVTGMNGMPAQRNELCAPQIEAITEPTGKRAKSYSMGSFREASTATAYSFLDFYSNYWNGVTVFEAAGAGREIGSLTQRRKGAKEDAKKAAWSPAGFAPCAFA